ncbi:hypothetical protein Poli38472_009319 [Pythium oligandrum]|uniref:Hexose transporter 1 n=1 Tax=Pythium oligandrum TaxID=41045 RepID=A0A8K1CKI5_PYTOL|nr:hypothetical protein Poli38472_009319 [Pythium oligandrum]|eukprot:TMW65152.1 hypothetical protein Poli38472_009319 [Pythium oligandrum]
MSTTAHPVEPPAGDYIEAHTPTTERTGIPDIQVTVESPVVHPSEARMNVKPTYVLYTSCFLGLLIPLQYGWSTSQLNYSKFNRKADCDARPVADGTCIMFSGHTKLQWIFVVNAWIFGGMVGALTVGRFSDRLGRKRVMQSICLLIITGAIIMASSFNLKQFVVGRFIAGLASGATTGVFGGYTNEIAPPSMRALLGVILQSGNSIGIILVASTFFYLDFEGGWRIIACGPILLAGGFLALSPFFVVESPVWLLLKGRHQEAEEVLTRLYGKENVPTALGWLEHKVNRNADTESVSKALTFRDLISPKLRRQFIIGVGLACMQKITGINTVFYYSSDTFVQAGIKDGRIGTIIAGFVISIPTCISGVFARRYGNRPMLLTSVAGMLASAIGITLALTYEIQWLTVLFMCTYVGTFGLSLGPVLYVIIADVVPDYARARMTSINVFAAWFSNLCVGIGYPYIASSLNHLQYVPFVVLLVLSLAFVYFIIPETNGKTNDEIQEEFRLLRERH